MKGRTSRGCRDLASFARPVGAATCQPPELQIARHPPVRVAQAAGWQSPDPQIARKPQSPAISEVGLDLGCNYIRALEDVRCGESEQADPLIQQEVPPPIVIGQV